MSLSGVMLIQKTNFSYLCSYCGRFSSSCRLNRINWIWYLSDGFVRAMPPIQRLRAFLSFLQADGRHYQNHRVLSHETDHGTLFHLEQYFRKIFGALDALQRPFSSNENRKSTLPPNDNYLAQIRHFHKTKSIWRQNKITNVSKRFVYNVSKFSSLRSACIEIEQHLLLEPSIDR